MLKSLSFEVFATIRNYNNNRKCFQEESIDWNTEDQILSWYPNKDTKQNQIVMTLFDKKNPTLI